MCPEPPPSDAFSSADEILHAAEADKLERKMMQLALQRTGSHHGAVFLWDEDAEQLRIDFHVVEEVEIELAGVLLKKRTDGRPNGIAWHVVEHNVPYLTNDTSTDPNYAEYFFDVQSIAAVPVQYQGRAIGAITVSSTHMNAYRQEHLDALADLARASATLLRRVQIYRRAERRGERPVLVKGLSREWLAVENLIERVAPTDAPVLIRGESGTGKELIAHAIHYNSRRADKPFVAINCAAIAEQLLESTLFGHVRGAFTGAEYVKVGEFEKADGGTLLLDEVAELSPNLQGKVLRALELGEIQPLGSNEPPKHVDVRVVAATNRNLERMMRRGDFRDDLYYRIAVVSMSVPPLRTYLHNLEVLCQMFVTRANAAFARDIRAVSPQALAVLRHYDFPGNVRELRNIIDHAVIVTQGPLIQPQDLSLRASGDEPEAPTTTDEQDRPLPELRKLWVAERERMHLAMVLDQHNGNVAEAARGLGIDRTSLYRLLRKYRIRFRRRTERD